jgi:peptidoglycan/LPS O-acetylase OafA/YrhL
VSGAVATSGSTASNVEPAVAPPPGNPRFPLVDGLRAVAALSVVVYHTAYSSSATEAWYGGFAGRLEIGVALFFAISGFLLYRPFFAAHYAGRPRIRTRDYLRRRFLRIVPAYWVALTVLAIYPGLIGVFTGDWWIYYGFGQIYQQDTFNFGIPPAWTLCVEVSFYLALPLYALALRRICRGRELGQVVRIELVVLALLAVGSLVYRTVAIANGPNVYYTWLPGMFDWFATGMALAVLSVALQARERPWKPAELVARRPGLAWLAAGAVFTVLALTVPAPTLRETFYTEGELFRIHSLSAVIAVLVLLPAVAGRGRGGGVRRLLGWRTLAWLGLISYGIYLWHQTLMLWLVDKGALGWVPGSGFLVLTALTVLLAVSCAAGSYYVVERPLLRFKDPRRKRRAG